MKTTLDNSGVAVCELTRKEYEALLGKLAALDVAVTGLREFEATWAVDAEALDESDPTAAEVMRESVGAISALLDKIGARR